MNTQPLVSFIVSVYNLERYIGECLDSILAQPFDGYEIVLVDNNSTDGSKAICRGYAAQHKLIRYFELDGAPLFGRAVLYGFKVARGKYIHVVDGDDMLSPEIYREIAGVLREKEPDLLFGRFETFSDDLMLNFIDVPYSAEAINSGGIDAAIAYLADRLPLHLTAWRLVFRRDKKYDDLKIATTQAPVYCDAYVNNSTLMLAETLHYIDKPIYRYRLRRSSISRMPAAEQASEAGLTLIGHQALLRIEGLSEQKNDYILKVMDAWQYSLCAALSVLDTDGVRQCAANVKDYEGYFPKLDGDNLPDDRRYPFLSAYLAGKLESGLERLQASARQTISRICESLPAGSVYLSPTGNVGANIQAAFAAHGVTVSGFFDNDEKKDGALLGGVPIRLPSAVTKADTPATVVVASMYANVRRDLKQQFLSLGVSESNITVIEF